MVDFVELSKSDLWAIKPGPNFISNDFHHELGAFQNRLDHAKQSDLDIKAAVESNAPNSRPNQTTMIEESLLWPYYGIENDNYQLPSVLFLLSTVLLPGYDSTIASSTVLISGYAIGAAGYFLVLEKNQKSKKPHGIDKRELQHAVLNFTPAVQPYTRDDLLHEVGSLTRE